VPALNTYDANLQSTVTPEVCIATASALTGSGCDDRLPPETCSVLKIETGQYRPSEDTDDLT